MKLVKACNNVIKSKKQKKTGYRVIRNYHKIIRITYLNIFVPEYQYVEKNGHKVVGNFYYKLHTPKFWWYAKATCYSEWAKLFYPVDQEELDSILPMLNNLTIMIGAINKLTVDGNQ